LLTLRRGFLNVSKIALEKAVDSIFADQGMVGLARALYCHQEWRSGVSTQSYLLTLDDYIGDLKEWLDTPFFKRATEVRSLGLVAFRIQHAANSCAPLIWPEWCPTDECEVMLTKHDVFHRGARCAAGAKKRHVDVPSHDSLTSERVCSNASKAR
jgi:hypothetical protein